MSQDQQYWLPGYGLSRHIVLSRIQYFLGPTASARPYSLQGREGYLIVGTPLTRVRALCPDSGAEASLHGVPTTYLNQKQIDDLKTLSQQYERQAAIRMTSNSNSNDNTNENSSEPYINQLIPVGLRDRRKGPVDHWTRHDRT